MAMTALRLSDDLKLPPAVVTEKLAFLGRTGSGKTYAAQKLAEEMHDAGAQFVVLDPVGVWYGLRLAADGKKPGLPIPVLGGLRGDIPLEPTGGALIANLVVDRATSVVLDVSQFESDAAKARFAQDFADRFFFRKKAAPSAVHVFIEEAQEFVPQNPQREEARMLHAFTRLVKIGRNFGIGVSLISQRPQEVNKKVLNLAELLFAFQLTGPQERKTIEGWIADKGLDEDIAGELPKLAVGHPHVWSPAWLKISKVVAIGTKTTFDASSTPVLGKAAAARELSPIDLEQLRTEMAATIEKAKQEDPRELRAEIARLRAELKKKAPAAAPAAASKTSKPEDREKLRELAAELGRLRKALEAAMKFIITVSTHKFDVAGVDKAEIEKAIQAAIDRAVKMVDERMAARGRELKKLRDQAEQLATALAKVKADQTVEISVDVTRNEPFTVAPTPRAARANSAPPSAGLTGPQQAILDTVAMLGVRGISPERDTVARWLGIHPNGGSYGTNLGFLRAEGYLAGFTLTDKGRAAARDQETGLEAALAALDGEPKRNIIRVLLEAGAPMSREELAATLGLHPNGGSYGTNLGWLRTMGLITERGPIQTTDALVR
jgi:hypothetical protein